MMIYFLNFLNAVSSQYIDFFIEEEEVMNAASESSPLPAMFITGFVIALIILFFLRRKFRKKTIKVESKAKKILKKQNK